MKKIYFKNLNEHLGREITIEGFVESIRNLQYVQFLVLRDTTGKVQVTVEKNEENKKLLEKMSEDEKAYREHVGLGNETIGENYNSMKVITLTKNKPWMQLLTV